MTCVVTQGLTLRRALHLVSVVTVLKFLIFEQGTLHFHFALDCKLCSCSWWQGCLGGGPSLLYHAPLLVKDGGVTPVLEVLPGGWAVAFLPMGVSRFLAQYRGWANPPHPPAHLALFWGETKVNLVQFFYLGDAHILESRDTTYTQAAADWHSQCRRQRYRCSGMSRGYIYGTYVTFVCSLCLFGWESPFFSWFISQRKEVLMVWFLKNWKRHNVWTCSGGGLLLRSYRGLEAPPHQTVRTACWWLYGLANRQLEPTGPSSWGPLTCFLILFSWVILPFP